MPGYLDEDDDYGQQDSGPKALRDALEKAKKDLKDRDDKIAELTATAAELSNKVKTSTLRDALTDAGVDPKYARFAERDGVEATVESVQKWVDESKEVYAFLAPKDAPPAADDGDDGADDGPGDQLPPDLVAGLLAGQNLESIGRPGGSASVIDILSTVDPGKFENAEQVDAFIRGLGAPTTG